MKIDFAKVAALMSLAAFSASAQVLEAPSAPGGPAPAQPAPAQPSSNPPAPAGSASQQPKQSSFLGKDIPVFNPANDVMTWDGKSWNINNNRIFEARFEKYLNAPEEANAEDKQYREIIKAILDKLAP